MHVKKVLSAAAAGAFALASVTAALAQGASTAPHSPAAQAPGKPSGMTQPQAPDKPSGMTQPQAQAQTPSVPGTSDPYDPAVARRMTAEELKKHVDAKEKVYILDTRGHVQGPIVKGAAMVPVLDIDTWAKDIPKNSLIVAYCT